MERSQLSRDFSARVQTNFHKRGDPFRFRMWMVSLWVGLIACSWLLWNSVMGSPEIYTAGTLSTPHHMFESRCEVCHLPFSGPLDRILSLGRDTKATSAPDQKCLACHDGAGHFYAGDPDLSYHDRHQPRILWLDINNIVRNVTVNMVDKRISGRFPASSVLSVTKV